jgi:hypothetical protein
MMEMPYKIPSKNKEYYYTPKKYFTPFFSVELPLTKFRSILKIGKTVWAQWFIFYIIAQG